ncbi:MAG: response regulator [Ignavibacterium album]|jgi:DNA-binding response OmpR family regulator|uniref:Response regulator n=1 Tax=Ignavibacterium album TaxID=591197 RepID=A0A7V2ZI85_9BACT|nr:response regulator [Ignavibacterium album]MCX8106332.1 response regulator [Ignavibacterium album]
MNNRAINILIVDDSDLTRSSLTKLFSDYNCNIITSIDGLDGIQKSLTSKPDIILLDILMPNLDGIKMLQVIKIIDELKKIPVIVISGNSNRTNVFASLEAGADKVITKPIDEDVLIKSIEELTKRKLTHKQKIEGVIVDSTIDELKKIYIKAFPQKEVQLNKAIAERDKYALGNIFHELKGVSASMGFPEVTEISRMIELALNSEKIDWNYIKNQTDEIISIIERKTFSLNGD